MGFGRTALALASAAGSAVVTLAAPVAAQPPAAAPPTLYFEGQTTATAVHLTVTQKPASSIITASLVDDAAAYAASAFDSSGSSEAQAATYYPGNLVVQGPGLLCSQLFPCPAAPPDYPLLADASYPRSPAAHADGNQQQVGSGPFVVDPAHADAAAAAAGNSGSTATGAVSLLAGTPGATTIGASSARSTLTSTTSSITLHVESTVSDVTVAGLLHIASVHAVDDIVVRPGAKPVDSPAVTVTGVTVAGQAASIDDSGIHVAGQQGPSLAQKLSQQGVTVRTVGVSKADQPLSARSDATGLMLTFSAPVSGVPYVPNPLPSPFDVIPGVNANGTYLGTLTLGSAGAVAAGQAQPGFDLGGVLPPVGPVATAATGTPAAPGTSSAAAGQVTAAVPPVAPVVAGRPSALHAVLDAFSLADLYAALALGTVVMFLGWRGMLLLRRGMPTRGPRPSWRRG